MDVALATRGERNVGGGVKARDGGTVNNKGTRGPHGKVVKRDGTVRERGEGQPLCDGEVGLLYADNITFGDKVKESGVDEGATGNPRRGSSIIRETIDIVGDDARDEGGSGNEGGEGRSDLRGRRVPRGTERS